jgi:hypothetical protein
MRPASTYRAALRNEIKAKRQLPIWRATAAAKANERANLAGRAAIANGAREVAAKAIRDANIREPGKRHDTISASAMLGFYRTVTKVKCTRAMGRIIRELERQVRA